MTRMLLLTLSVAMFGIHGVICPRNGYEAPSVSARVTIETQAEVKVRFIGEKRVEYGHKWVTLVELPIKGSADKGANQHDNQHGIEESNARAAVDEFLSINGFEPRSYIIAKVGEHLYKVQLDLPRYGTIKLYQRVKMSIDKPLEIANRAYYVCDKLDRPDSVYNTTLREQLDPYGMIQSGAHKVALDTMHKELSEEERKAAIDALLASYNLNLEKDKDSVKVYDSEDESKQEDRRIIWTVEYKVFHAHRV